MASTLSLSYQSVVYSKDSKSTLKMCNIVKGGPFFTVNILDHHPFYWISILVKYVISSVMTDLPMKIIAGCSSRATANNAFTVFSPSPTYNEKE